MRRLYSTFAAGWPGIGLLVIRLVVGSVLLATATGSRLGSEPPLHLSFSAAALALSGLLLIAGLWTPVVGAVITVFEIAQMLKGAEHPLVSLLAATIAAALAMLGPGRWSIDARLFGWRRIEVPPRTDSSNVR